MAHVMKTYMYIFRKKWLVQILQQLLRERRLKASFLVTRNKALHVGFLSFQRFANLRKTLKY